MSKEVPFKELQFEQQLIESIKQNMMTNVAKMDFIMPDYSNRMKIPSNFLDKAWALVDQESVLKQFAIKLETELVDRIMNQMASEIATDIKQVLSNKERREEIRAVARTMINKIASES